MKRLRFIFLAVIILATMVVFSVCASAEVLSGKCGENVSYTLNTDTGELRIFGTGKMEDYGHWTFNNEHTAWYNNNTKNVIIEHGVTSIGGFTFSDCKSLTKVSIPDSVTSIGDYAFRGCTSLTNITIPDSVTEIGYGAFEGCTSLTSVTIPDGVTLIDVYTFHGCASLTNITIPDSVTYIGVGAFDGCTGLQNTEDDLIYIKASDNPYFYLYGVVNTSITSCIINENTKFIGGNAFKKCTSLTNITIPGNVTEIGGSAFYVCKSLQNITIPDSVTYIDIMAFDGCTSLTNITIPESVTYIGSLAFAFSTNLTNICIPDSVTYIGDGAFRGCPNLTITGYEGSYAEEYAKENNIPFNVIPKHTHSYTSEVIKPATCTSTGSKKFTCSCGDTYTETIAKLPHESDNWTILIPAKAGTEGVECGLCKVCGVVAMRSIEALPKDRPVFRLTPAKTESGYAVTLSLENNVNGFYSLGVIVKYDSEKLNFVNADTSNAIAKFEAANTSGSVFVNYTDTAYMPNKGELCTMYFEPNGDLLSGNTEVVINTVVSDNPYTAVNCTVNLGEEEAPENTTVIMTIGQAAGFVSGKAYALDAAPIIRNDRTMLPVRFVAEAFGAEVGWDGATSTATVKTEEVEMRITIGASTAIVNGEEVALDSPAFIENSRTYLPVRFVAENLGASVAWNGVTSTATLTK